MNNNKQQIIVLCGPDMTGKTEIAKALSKQLKIPYFKASSEHDTYLKHPDRFVQQLQYSDTRLVDFLKQTGHSVIMDRAYPCEKVYSSVLGRKTMLDVLTRIDEQMALMGAKIIICHRSSYKGIVDDIDPKLNSDLLQRLDEAYKAFTHWTRCSTLLLNVDDENLKRELGDILRWISL